MSEIRRRIKGRLTDEQRDRHRQIIEQVAKDRPLMDALASAKMAELRSLRSALSALKEERLVRGLSLDDVAARTGIDRSRLIELESDEFPNPTLEQVTRIAHAIGVRLNIAIETVQR